MDLSGACRDPKARGERSRTNDQFLACAVEGRAHYLVSSDRDLLDLRRYRGVAIVNPGQFLVALELHPLDVETLAARFGHDALVEVRASVPLEPGTAARVREAAEVLS